MDLYGLQKLTLLDFPGRVACTLFTGGCNFRCPFCHNAALVVDVAEQEAYSEEEIMSFLQKRRGVLDGVAVTGGEPLLMRELPEFLRRVRSLGYAVKLDTNGSFPDRLAALLDEGLVDYVAMDIKNSLAKYGLTVGLPDLDTAPIEKSIALLMNGAVPYEFRTTVVKQFHTEKDMSDIGRLIAGARAYYLQQFKDGEGNICPGLEACTPEQMSKYREILLPFVPNTELRGI
ncbi:MAG: anaerobic ribonucleoside-triphosphate reductase activating protein [Eubacteriales bacterium]|nr:anaerobic ribonucleoside-triphosphate reductase activating protein [Eubacteriales bacterium]